MSSAMKAALMNSKSSYIPVRSALFHSTPVMERKRRNHWDSRCNHYSRRFRRMQSKQTLLRNVSAYADFLFESWKGDADEDDPSSSRGTSWFRKQYSTKGSRGNRNGNQGSRYQYRRNADFCEDDIDIETIFRSAFGGNRFSYWSFVNEENPQWKRSGHSSYYERSWNWRHRNESSDSEYDSSTESNSSVSNLASDRLALGLSASGPLKLEDVKNAYRVCALKWHPDRHHGSSKAIAEEKFKLCSAAYQSLCDNMN